MKRLSFRVLPALLLLPLASACSLKRWSPPPLAREAAEALSEARELERLRPEGWRERAFLALARAREAAPDWVAPRRVEDDLQREFLLGHEALALRRADLEQAATRGTARAEETYLVGRLEGREGFDRLQEAARLDPELGWAQHGVAWQRFLSGQTRGALRAGRRALELARGSYELGVFAGAQARYLLELGRTDAAIAGLETTLADPRLGEPERTELATMLARAELRSEDGEVVERGFWRSLAEFESRRLTEDEYERLGAEILAQRSAVRQPDALALVLAALPPDDPRSERLRARVLLERGSKNLATLIWERAPSRGVSDSFARLRALERGEARAAMERWRGALPSRLLDSQGLPREPRLSALVSAAREADDGPGAVRFGEALVEAGWFSEAEAWASFLVQGPDVDAHSALALEARASAGLALLAGMQGVLEHVDQGRPAFTPVPTGHSPDARALPGLSELLEALQPFFERARGAPLALDLARSPRLSFGGLAAVVHPGPRFSALDEREGRGPAGAEVPGLATELARIGRFGIFGQAPGGGGPDGTVLRVVGGEWVSGQHLGVPFEGWVAWCEGADLESRAGRAGSSVSGAALHEGYWIDIEGVRGDRERLGGLERKYLQGEPGLLARALEGRGPRLSSAGAESGRARWLAPLGEGERVALSALRERPLPPGETSRVSLDEWVELTALHEQGHLTDRTRFLPLAKKWPRGLAFLLRNGFSPRALARALEYRAQLVALCVADEPRLVLADCLAAADSEGGVLAHSEAYRELLEDFLALTERDLEHFPALDREHYLLYQLHFLAAEDVRRLAHALAVQNGMCEEG